MERVPTTLYLWISRLAGFAGIVCIVIALVTGVTDSKLVAAPGTYVQIAIAAFLFAIWGVLYEIRDRGIKTRQ
jgi:archaellum biogenesis protein FlaJ (TadC family)